MTPRVIVAVTDKLARGFGVANGIRAAKALRRLGHTVSVIDHKGISREALAGADLILSFGTVVRAENESPGYFKRIAALKDPGAVAALWYFDMCNPRQRHAPYKPKIMRAIAGHLDWLFMTDHSYPWENHTKNFMHLPQGIDPADFAWDVRPPEPRNNDVIFTGGCDRFFEYRRNLINALKPRFKVALFGRGTGHAVYGRNFFAAHQRARTVLVPEPPPEANDHYWSNRIFLAAATGTPCVVGYVNGIEDYYEDGKEVVYYRNRSELVQIVASLVKDPARRHDIGVAARARTLAEHTYEARCRTMIEAIERGAAH